VVAAAGLVLASTAQNCGMTVAHWWNSSGCVGVKRRHPLVHELLHRIFPVGGVHAFRVAVVQRQPAKSVLEWTTIARTSFQSVGTTATVRPLNPPRPYRPFSTSIIGAATSSTTNEDMDFDTHNDQSIANDGDDDDGLLHQSPMLRGLNPSQVQAVTQPIESVTRVVAGPGSGKTRVLTSRIAYLLQHESSSNNGAREYRGGAATTRILGVTFTRKAAGEMQGRLHKLLLDQQEYTSSSSSSLAPPMIVQEQVGDVVQPHTPTGLDRVTLGTFHSICAKILRWNGENLSTLPSVIDDMKKNSGPPVLDGNFNICDQSEQVRIIKEILDEYNIDLKPLDLKPLQVHSAVCRIKALLATGTQDPFATHDAITGKPKPISPVGHIAQKMYYPYRERLLSTNCIDFDDLILLAREMLLVHEPIRAALQRRWQHGAFLCKIGPWKQMIALVELMHSFLACFLVSFACLRF
jgi:UvrD/REP helicase N-terminal domain